MQDFVFFVGRFHVLALHLPIGILIAAVVLDWLARRPRYAALAQASAFLWAGTAITAVFTAALGYMHYAEGAFTGPSGEAHRFWGSVTAIAALGGWWLAARGRGAPGAARLAAGLTMLALVSITGHYGGNLTHGTTFLEEYAPSFLRSLIGAAPRGPTPTTVAAADPNARAATDSAAAHADPTLVASLAAAGLLARQVSQSDARLVVSVSSPGTPLDAPALEALATAASEIVDLNLAGTGLGDAGLEAIGALPAATHLRLARNALTDEALAALASSPQLEHLNLYGNAGITDSSIESLAALGALREVFLWQTGVTDSGAARLRALRPDLSVDMGATNAPQRDGG